MDYRKFLEKRYIPRTAFVSVPELKEFFGDEQAPGFTVRGLDAAELALAQSEAMQDIVDLTKKIMSGVVDQMAEGLKKLFEAHEDVVPESLARNYHLFMFGLVAPDIPVGDRLEFAERFSQRFPIDFLRVCGKISELTGMGQTSGE